MLWIFHWMASPRIDRFRPQSARTAVSVPTRGGRATRSSPISVEMSKTDLGGSTRLKRTIHASQPRGSRAPCPCPRAVLLAEAAHQHARPTSPPHRAPSAPRPERPGGLERLPASCARSGEESSALARRFACASGVAPRRFGRRRPPRRPSPAGPWAGGGGQRWSVAARATVDGG